MQLSGDIRKMNVQLNENEVEYEFSLVDVNKEHITLFLNEFIGKSISIQHTGIIRCKRCGNVTKTSFQQGFCYTCFRFAPEASECIINPERCKAHLGEGRDPEWEERYHNRPHIVYLASTNVVKVGVTQQAQLPTRWIDQGASKAIQFAVTPNRYQAGIIEVALKSMFTDKTNWRKMLKNEVDPSIDLEEVKWETEESLPEDITQFLADDDTVLEINYPVIQYPAQLKSINLTKTPLLTGKLMGIKGQYLLLDENRVINIRKHTGYEVHLNLKE